MRTSMLWPNSIRAESRLQKTRTREIRATLAGRNVAFIDHQGRSTLDGNTAIQLRVLAMRIGVWAGEQTPEGKMETGETPVLLSIFHRHDQVLHDVIFALGRILAHVEGEDAGHFGALRVFHFAHAHFFADELLELARRNF